MKDKTAMETYSFYTKDAEKYGIEEAIFLFNIRYWTSVNEANNRNFHDGKFWTYNTQEAFSKLFPFWSRRQIQRILNNLKERGAIIEGNYNKKSYDRTKWYALCDGDETVHSNARNGAMERTESCNGLHETVQPIPYINTDRTNTNDKHIKDIVVEVINHLNASADTHYKSSTKKTKTLIHARLAEGFSKENFMTVIDRKCQQWKNDKKMSMYLRPETLFGTKFESYLNEKGAENGSHSGFTQTSSPFNF